MAANGSHMAVKWQNDSAALVQIGMLFPGQVLLVLAFIESYKLYFLAATVAATVAVTLAMNGSLPGLESACCGSLRWGKAKAS
jgi:hypothetical protein